MTKIGNFFKGIKNKIMTINIYDNAKFFLLAPLIIVLVMLICGTTYHLTNTKFDYFANIGVDFQGGTLLTVEFSESGMNSGTNFNKNLALIDEVLKDNGFTISVSQSSGDSSIIVRYLNKATENGEIVDYSTDEMVSEMNAKNDVIREAIAESVESKYGGSLSVKSTATMIGNSASVKLLRTALISVSIALALMLIYIVIRFDLYSGLAAIAALLHDIIIMMAFTVIFYVEISSTIVAAIITIVAYSINNTIIVFDKIRTTVKPYKKTNQKYDLGEVVNNSIFSTMTRTLYTTLTTLVVIAFLAILGVASIRTFALPILFGLVAGFYSSVFLAGPFWGFFKDVGFKIKTSRANKKFKKSAKPSKT